MELGLDHGLKRLMLFRVVVVTTLLLVAISVESVSETLGPVNPLYWLIAATYSLTILYALALRFLPVGAWQVYVQGILDLAFTTGLVYMSGGTATRGGFVVLYPIVVLAGSVLLRRRDGLVLAGLATVFYAGLLWGAREGWAQGFGLDQIRDMPARQVLYPIFVTGVSCATVALVGTYLSESLQSAGHRLEEASEEMADLRELNRTIVESIQSGLIIADPDGRVLFLNQFGEGILGRRNAEVRGTLVSDVFGAPTLEPATLVARAAHRRLSRMDLSYAAPGGGSQDLGLSVSHLAGTETPRKGYLLVFQDLSPIKRLEEEARTNEKLAAVGEMASQLAHEIRNPLGSISGSAQVLMDGVGLPTEQVKLLEIITKESRRLSDTLNRFLFHGRPSAHVLAPVDLGPLLTEAVTLLRNAPEVGPGHRVELRAERGPHVCLADRDQILQVFWNLARNGLEAMPEGGVLSVHLARRRDEVVLAVRDEGRGMGGEEQRRLFQPMRSGTPMGTGLGLAIVYRIVREHRGDISVRSVPRQGTEVEVRLPLVAASVSA